MCTNGVNTGQLEMMIDQIDDPIKRRRRRPVMQADAQEVALACEPEGKEALRGRSQH